MFRNVLTLIALVASLSEISGQEALKVPEDKRIWFTSAPGAVDLLEMATRSNEPRYGWNEAKKFISVFQYYQGYTLPYAWKNAEGNTFEILSRGGFFESLKNTHGVEQAIEVGVIKWHTCDWKNSEISKVSVTNTVESIVNVEKSGGSVRYITIDSAMAGGYECENGALTPVESGILIAQYMKEVRGRLREIFGRDYPIEFGDVDPYPLYDIGKHKWYIDTINREALKLGIPGLSYYHADVDMNAVRSESELGEDIRSLAIFVKRRGIRFGMTIGGYDVNTNLDYFKTALPKVAIFKNQRLEEAMDNIVIQSWSMTKDGRQYLPPNVPDDEPHTHTNFVLHILNCFFTPGWDCNTYPKPR